VNGVRYGFLGVSEVDPRLSFGLLAGGTVLVTLLDVSLFKRGYGLTD